MEIETIPIHIVDSNISQPSLGLKGGEQLSINRGNFRTTRRDMKAIVLLSVTPVLPGTPHQWQGATQQAICASPGHPWRLPDLWCWCEGWGRDAQPHQQHRVRSVRSDREAEPQAIFRRVVSPAALWQTHWTYTCRKWCWVRWWWGCSCCWQGCPASPKISCSVRHCSAPCPVLRLSCC